MDRLKETIRLKTSQDQNVLRRGGEMGALMRARDWAATPLGPVEQWPQSLRTALGILLDSGYPMYIAWGPQFIQFYNDAYRPILGSTKHPAALGQSTPECFAEIWDFIGPMFERVMLSGENTTLVDQLLPLERFGYPEECYFTFSYSAIRDESDSVGGVFVTVIETTGRVLSERRMRTLRELAAQGAESKDVESAARCALGALGGNPYDLPFALLYLVDANGGKAVLAGATGVSQGSPECPREVVVHESYAFELLDRIVNCGDVLALSSPVSCPWPEPVTTAIALPLLQTGQRPMGYLVAGINPRKKLDDDYRSFLELAAGHIAALFTGARAYQQERERAETLARLDRAKTAFFSNVSHEFRTPLTLILGTVEEMLRGAIEDPLRADLRTVHRNGLRLLRMVNTLLDFSRIESGKFTGKYEPTDLAALTTEIAGVFRSAIERAGLELIVECGRLTAPVYLDHYMWERILLNLLSNALKFTFAGHIRVYLTSSGKYAQVSVADTGEGIPADQVPRLFERFHRVEGTYGRSHEGTGIGLALVQEFVNLHGGHIEVASTPGLGTTFTISLPFGSQHLPADQVRGQSPETGRFSTGFAEEAERWIRGPGRVTRPEHGAAATILVADDNADMRDYAVRLLSDTYNVVTVSDGTSAIEAAVQHPPDLILCDVMMPGLDGLTVLKELRQRPETSMIPMILLSARAGEESTIAGLDTGADDYLVKPFSARELVSRVRAHLQTHKTRKRAIERIRLSEERYRSLVTATAALVWNAAADGSFDSQQAAWEAFTGQSFVEYKGWGFLQAVHPDDRQNMAQVWTDAVNNRTVFVFEHRLWHAAGQIFRYVICRAAPVPGRDGKAREWVAIVYDIHERKLSEQALRRSEERLRLAVEGAGMGTWDRDMRTGETVWSQNHYQLLGYNPLTTVASFEAWRDRLHPADAARVLEESDRAMRERQMYRTEYRIIRADNGETVWLGVAGRYLYDLSGEAIRFIGVFFEVTEHKKAVEALGRSEERFRLAIEAAQLGVFECNVRSDAAIWENDRMYEIMGRSPAEGPLSLNNLLTEVIDPADAKNVRSVVQAAIRNRDRFVATSFRIRRCDGGSVRWIESAADLDFDDRGVPHTVRGVLADITERRHMHEALSESEERFRRIFEESPLGILLVSPDWRVTHANPSFCSLIGRSEQEVDGTNLLDLLHPRDRQLPADVSTSQASASGQWAKHPKRFLRSDGEIVWTEVSFTIRLDALQQAVGFLGLVENVTARKLAEEALRRSESKMRLVTDSVPALIGYIDRNFCYQFANQTYGEWFRIPQPEIVGKTVAEVLGAVAAESLRPHMERALAGERVFYEALAPYATGPRHIRASYIPDFGDDGAVRGFAVLVEDISEQKLAQDALRESERRFHMMADSAPVMIWLAGPDRLCYWVNAAWLQFTGAGMREQLGDGWTQFIHPDDLAPTIATYEASFDARQNIVLEYRLRRHDGEWRWVLDNGIPRFGAHDQFLGYIGSCIDIHDRKEMEQMLRRMNADLEQFAYSVSHDLQEPLRNVAIYTELLGRRCAAQLGPNGKEYLGFVTEGARRLEMLVRDLLAYTRTSNIATDSEQVCEASAAVFAALSNLEERVRATGAKISVDPLPRVRMHALHLQQVFQNLISNALKYRSAQAPVVRIRAKRDAGACLFQVTDNGIGIDPQYHQSIFGIFKRLHSGSAYAGTGIGLAICQQLVERYGGRIWVESEVGRGSAFYFTIPLPASEE